MTVATDRHTEYTSSFTYWQRCRDANAGEDLVKKRGEAYLPRLGGQSDADYDAYKMRARFRNGFGKTIKGFVGLATRKEPILEQPESFAVISSNVDRSGADVADYVKMILSQVLEVGRCGTLVDFTNVSAGATLQEQKSARPYWVMYKTEDILDWEYSEGALIYVSLRELIPVRGSRYASGSDKYRYRTLEVIDGVYTQRVYSEKDNTFEEIIPQVNGSSLSYLPFTIHQEDFDDAVEMPPLLDLVNLCLAHYRLKADHAHALHYVALPTPWITGVDPDDENSPSTIGPQKLWKISNPDAQVGMLEFTGAGVDAIDKELKNMEDDMAVLGARILLPEVSEHTATASNLRSISETSDLSSIIGVLEKQMNQLLQFTALWANASGEVSFSMYRNLLPKDMDAQMVTALVAAWQNSAFDYETLVENFKKAEIVPIERNVEELRTSTENEEQARAEKAQEALSLLVSDEDEDEE